MMKHLAVLFIFLLALLPQGTAAQADTITCNGAGWYDGWNVLMGAASAMIYSEADDEETAARKLFGLYAVQIKLKTLEPLTPKCGLELLALSIELVHLEADRSMMMFLMYNGLELSEDEMGFMATYYEAEIRVTAGKLGDVLAAITFNQGGEG